jgi:large subunit ribosomal protein L6
VRFDRQNGDMVVQLKEGDEQEGAIQGLSRALLYNMVTGVAQGYRKSLEIQGAGYRAQASGKGISLIVGYTHPVQIEPPAGVSIQVEANTRIHVEGADKEAVGQTAAKIRDVRPPEVYTGKGIRYQGEQVRRKAGKATGRRK